MNKLYLKLHKDNKGSTLIETLIVLPVFILVILLIVNLGQLIHARQLSSTAAKEGAKAASTYTTKTAAKTAAEYVARPIMQQVVGYDSDGSSVNILNYSTDYWVCEVKVKCKYLFPGFLGNDNTITSSVVMRREGQIK